MERTITADAVPQAKTRTMTNFRWKIAFLIFLISFVAYMDRVNLSVATPVIMQEFGFDKMDMGFLQTCFFAGYALMQVPGGMLAERFGLRKTGAGAILWWSVFTALTAFAQGKASFAAVRLAFGLGEGPVFPSLGQATFNWFNKDEKGKASSAILLGTFFGPVIGPMVTVALIAALGWHAVFIIFGLAGCVLAWVWHRYAQDNQRTARMSMRKKQHSSMKDAASPQKRNLLPGAVFSVPVSSGHWASSSSSSTTSCTYSSHGCLST